MKWIVEIKNDLTAYDTWRGDDPGREDEYHETTDNVSQEIFNTEEEAMEYYQSMKSSLRWSRGMYVTYPRKAGDK